MLRIHRAVILLLITVTTLLAVPVAPIAAEPGPAPATADLVDVGTTPQFLRDLPELQGLVEDADSLIVGGGYLYWSRCRLVDSGGAYYLRRWPLGGGRPLTLQGSFCSMSTAAADATGLYYWDNGAIVRRSTDDPFTPITITASAQPTSRIIVNTGTSLWPDYLFWLANNTLYSANRYSFRQLAAPEPLGSNARSLLFHRNEYFYWFADGVLKRAAKACLAFGGGACDKPVFANENGSELTDATTRLSSDLGGGNPLWVSADGASLRSYKCRSTPTGITCAPTTEYTAPARSGVRGAISALATDGTYLFWVENSVRCGGFGCSLNSDSRLMKWKLERSLFSADPFDTPQPIASENSGGATYAIPVASDVAVANGWVFFNSSNGVARIRADAPPLSWNFAADSYEVTQGIQNLNNDVPLVAERATFVRFYGRKLDGPNAYGVEAILYGANANGAPLPGSPLRSLNATQDFTANNGAPNRADARSGWLFQLPPEWVVAGNIKLSPLIDPRRVWNDPDRRNNGITDGTFTFTRKAPICIVTVPVRTHAPAASNSDPGLFRMADVTRQLLPTSDVWIYHQDNDVAQLEARFGIPPWKYEPYAVPEKGDKILRSLWLRDALSDDPDRCDDVNAVTHYVGLVHAATNTKGNLGLGSNPGAQLYIKLIDQSTLNATTRFWTVQAFNTLAHELSHNYNRAHVNCGSPQNPDPNYPYVDSNGRNCVLDDGRRSGNPIPAEQRYYGFDPVSLTPIDPGNTMDYMAYGAPFWSSDYTWRNLFGRINSNLVLGEAPQALTTASVQAELAAAAQVVYLTGSIDPTANRGSLDYAWVYPTAELSDGMRTKLQRHAAPAASEMPLAADSYSVRLRDAGGNLLDERAVTLPTLSDTASTAKPFALTFPAPAAQVARLELLSGSTVIATLTPGAGVPTLSILSPTGGKTVDNQLMLSWRAADADANDKLLFTVQYSPDDGAHWRTMLTAFPHPGAGEVTAISLDQLSGLPGSAGRGRIRVAVSDGYNTTIATSQPFTVTPRPPAPYISSPGSALLPAGQPVFVSGGATDVVDGGLSAAALSWSLNGASLGSGATQMLNGLAPGAYDLALSATNAAGKVATVAVSFTVAPLVVPLAAAAPTLDGVCADPAFANAASVALKPYSDGAQASVRLVRSADALWACFTGMKRTSGSSPGTMAGIRLDPDNSRDATPQTGDYLFTLGEDGTLKQYVGNGSGYAAQSRAGASGQVSANGNTWTSELQIPAALLGGWGRVVGLAVEQAWLGAVGDDYFWPYVARWNSPASWATAALGDTPQLNALAPDRAPVGAGDRTITVTGSGFTSDTTALWNGAPRATTMMSATQLQVRIPAADLVAATEATIAVANAGMQAAPSHPLPFTVTNPVPRIDRLALKGKMLTVTGSNFAVGASVIWNGEQRPTIGTGGQLEITLRDEDLLAASETQVTAFNPGPGGGVSNIATLTSRPAGVRVYLPAIQR